LLSNTNAVEGSGYAYEETDKAIEDDYGLVEQDS
jgi:hypothetical protein